MRTQQLAAQLGRGATAPLLAPQRWRCRCSHAPGAHGRLQPGSALLTPQLRRPELFVHGAVPRAVPERTQEQAAAAATAAATVEHASSTPSSSSSSSSSASSQQSQQLGQQQLGQQQLEQQQQHQRQIAPSDAALSTLQEEQEEQLKALTSDLPRREARFEWLAFWVGAAVAFGAGIWYVEGSEKAQEYFAGYLLEQSLSVDNLFVFVLVFSYFKTPLQAQPKVLTYGIATAAVLRLVMILLGTELIESFQPLLVGFALILLYSAYGLLTSDGDDADDDLSDNAVVKACRRLLPVTDAYDGDNFFTTPAKAAAAAAAAAAAVASSSGGGGSAGAVGSSSSSSTNGAAASSGGGVAAPTLPSFLGGAGRVATPLLLTLAVVEVSDVLFAVDSIPAVFGVTRDPFIVYTSNMFAIFSLRSLYTFVSTVMTELRFLDRSVAVVLAFIGFKMILEFAGLEIPTDASLLVVGAVLGAGVGASLLLPEADDDDDGGGGGKAGGSGEGA